MSLEAFMQAIRTDKVYEAELKAIATAAEAAGRDTPEWQGLMETVGRHWVNPNRPDSAGACATTFTTVTTADCLTTTTTTTWY